MKRNMQGKITSAKESPGPRQQAKNRRFLIIFKVILQRWITGHCPEFKPQMLSATALARQIFVSFIIGNFLLISLHNFFDVDC